MAGAHKTGKVLKAAANGTGRLFRRAAPYLFAGFTTVLLAKTAAGNDALIELIYSRPDKVDSAIKSSPLLCTTEHLGILMARLDTSVAAFDYSIASSWLAQLRSDLFERKDKDRLVAGLKNEKISYGCSFAISWLANKRPDLFAREDVPEIFNGLKNSETAKGSATTLCWLANSLPGFFNKESLQELFAWAAKAETGQGCSGAIMCLSETRSELFSADDIAAISTLLGNAATRSSGIGCLFNLAVNDYDLAPQAVLVLLAGSKMPECGNDCKEALDRLGIKQ